MDDLVRAKAVIQGDQMHFRLAGQVLRIRTGRKQTLRVECQGKALTTVRPLDKCHER